VPTEPNVVFDTPSVVLATWREVALIHWRDRGLLPEMRRVQDHVLRFARAIPGRRIAVCTIINSTSIAIPDDAMREGIDAHTRAMEGLVRAQAIVIPVAGFAAATIRAVMAGALRLRRPTHPVQVLDSDTAALRWIAPYLEPVDGATVTEVALRDAFAAVLGRGARGGS
jgi:hypothetical protein